MSEYNKPEMEQTKKELLDALNEDFRKTRYDYGQAQIQYNYWRKEGNKKKALQYLRNAELLEVKLKSLNKEIAKITNKSTYDLYREKNTTFRRLTKEFAGDFEVGQHRGKLMLLFTVLLGIAVARFYGEKALLVFIVIAFMFMVFSIRRNQPLKLVPVKA